MPDCNIKNAQSMRKQESDLSVQVKGLCKNKLDDVALGCRSG